MDPRITPEVRVLKDPDTTLPQRIEAAARLWDLQEDIKDVLEDFKSYVRGLREVTDTDPGDTPTVTLEGNNLTRCKVTLAAPSLKLNPDTSPSDVLTHLGERHFNRVFTLTLRTTDPDTLNSLTEHNRRYLASITTLVTNPARVSVKSVGSVIPVTE